jgi:hypothetical protein
MPPEPNVITIREYHFRQTLAITPTSAQHEKKLQGQALSIPHQVA